MISAAGSWTFLAWLAAAAVPTLIYWLYRRRRTVVKWSANIILRQTIRQEGRKKLWQAVAIIALRSLAIVATVLSLAGLVRLRKPADGSLPHGEGTLHQIILYDNTRSMILRHGAGSREDEMRSRLALLLKRLRHGDHCDIILLAGSPGGRPTMLSPPCPVSNEWLAKQAHSLELQEAHAGVADALQASAERFSAVSARNRHLIWLGDLSRKDIPPSEELRPLKREMNAMNVKSVCYEIRDRSTEKPNLAIVGGESSAGILLPGWVCHLYVLLRNYGTDSAASSLAFQIIHSGQTIENRRIPLEIKAGEQRTIDLAFVPPAGIAGMVELKVETFDESYPFDNIRQWIVPARPNLKILLIVPGDEESVGNTLWRDSRYVELALLAASRQSREQTSPRTSGGSAVLARDAETGQIRYSDVQSQSHRPVQKADPVFEIKRVTDREATAAMIEESDVVIGDGICRIDPLAREALEKFVRRGGGLLLGLGDTVIPDDFNETFQNLTPLPLVETYAPLQRNRPDWEYDSAHQRIEKTFESSFLRRCLDESQSDIEHARIYNYMRLAVVTNGLMTMDTGHPLLVEKRFGRGAVLLWTSTLGGLWNTLPVRNVYVNLLQGMISYLAGFRHFNRNLSPGQPLIFHGSSNGVHSVIAPDESISTLSPCILEGCALFRCDDTALRGEYRLLRDGREVEKAVVWHTLPESDVRGISNEERTAFEDAIGIRVVESWNQVGPTLGEEPHAGTRLDGYFALVLLTALVADAVLTRVWFG